MINNLRSLCNSRHPGPRRVKNLGLDLPRMTPDNQGLLDPDPLDPLGVLGGLDLINSMVAWAFFGASLGDFSESSRVLGPGPRPKAGRLVVSRALGN